MNIEEIFKHLHENPELSFKEFETTEYIKKTLSDEGIEILPLKVKSGTGVLARVKGAFPGPSIGFRCDIDALPIQEKSGLPYASKKPGVMHACGHDIHTSTGILTASLVNKNKEKLHGTAYFLFQPAEELGKGAEEVLKTGALDGIDFFFALHSSPVLEAGKIGIKEGPITAAVGSFKIHVHGKGCHGAQPHTGMDPIVCAAAIIQSVQTIVSRNLSPLEAAVVSVTHVEAGSVWNIIPESAELEGTIRCFNEKTLSFIHKRLSETAENTALAYGCKAEVEIGSDHPATDNDKALSEYLWKKAEESGLMPVRPELTMVGEDFSNIQKKIRGIMVWVGVGLTEALHNPAFKADYKVIEPAADFFAKAILEYKENN